MSYFLRDRSDGQVEIILFRTVQIGLFPDWSAAESARTCLKDEQPELPPDEPSRFAQAAKDVAEAEDLAEILPAEAAPVRNALTQTRNLPAVVKAKPQAPVQITPALPRDLSDDEVQQAFARIQQGERIHLVAPDFGLSMGQLRGMWASHRRQMQKHLAQGSQQPCLLCQRMFTPSLSNPETCARCSHG